jgi:hypothetical protein
MTLLTRGVALQGYYFPHASIILVSRWAGMLYITRIYLSR